VGCSDVEAQDKRSGFRMHLGLEVDCIDTSFTFSTLQNCYDVIFS
jgi:hypothetical protein